MVEVDCPNISVTLRKRLGLCQLDLPASLQATGFPWEFPIVTEANDVGDGKILQELPDNITIIMQISVALSPRGTSWIEHGREEVKIGGRWR